MRKFLSDTFAMISFSTVFGMFTEILISKMTLGQSIQARLTAIPANFFSARPYGIYRDYIFAFFKFESAGTLKKVLIDILSFACFQVPLYAGILYFSGANLEQIMKACITLSLFSIFLGRPYGIFLDFSRYIFGVKKI